MQSRFLPADFDSSKPIAVIAGRDNYPLIMVKKILEHKIPVRLIAFKNETLPELIDLFPKDKREIIKVGQLGHMLSALEDLGACYAVMAGQVTPGKLFRGLHPDLKALAILTTLKEKNAESIFGAIADEIEKRKIHLLDARIFMDDELATKGLMSGKKFKIKTEHLNHGIEIARMSAKENIGQGVVVSKGTVLAVEAFEGTDAMLKRAGSFNAENTLFIKTVKPDQDYRFDVPVFGMRTLDQMAEAQISAVALKANDVIILDKDNVLEEAKKRGIPVLGY